MKKIFLICTLLISLIASAQMPTIPGVTNINQRYQWIDGYFYNKLVPPQDTVYSKIGVVQKGLFLYYGNGTWWTRVASTSLATYTGANSVRVTGSVIDLLNDSLNLVEDRAYASLGGVRTWYLTLPYDFLNPQPYDAIHLGTDAHTLINLNQVQNDGVVDGLAVTYVSGLTYNISPGHFWLNNRYHTFAGGNVTLPIADGSFTTIDLIGVDNSDLPAYIQGTPANPALEPTNYDGNLFLSRGFAQVDAGATVPTGVSSKVFYKENAGTPTEGAVSATGATINAAYTTNPHAGTYSIRTTAFTAAQNIRITRSDTLHIGDYITLSFWVKLNNPLTGTSNIGARLFFNNTAATAQVLYAGNYGMTRTNTAWQKISIPISAYTYANANFNQVRFFRSSNTGTIDFQIDDVQVESGFNPTPPPAQNTILFGRGDGSSTQDLFFNLLTHDMTIANGNFFVGDATGAKVFKLYAPDGVSGVIQANSGASLSFVGGGTSRIYSNNASSFLEFNSRVGDFNMDIESSGNTVYGALSIINTGSDVALRFGPESGGILQFTNIPDGTLDSIYGPDATGKMVRQAASAFGGGGGAYIPLSGSASLTGDVSINNDGGNFTFTGTDNTFSFGKDGANGFELTALNSGTGSFAQISGNTSGGGTLSLYRGDGTNIGSVTLHPTNGLIYGADYSANYTSLSLVDKGDLDAAIAGVSGLTIGTTSITSGASNRLLYQNGSAKVSQSSALTFDGNDLTASSVVIGNSIGVPYIQLPNSTTSRFLIGNEIAIANVTANDQFLLGAVAGDIVYRNTIGKLLFGNVGADAPGLTISGNQIGINNVSPSASAAVDITTTTKGLLPPRMTTSQRNAISSPATGLTLYCTDCTASDASTGVEQTYNGSTWKNKW